MEIGNILSVESLRLLNWPDSKAGARCQNQSIKIYGRHPLSNYIVVFEKNLISTVKQRTVENFATFWRRF